MGDAPVGWYVGCAIQVGGSAIMPVRWHDVSRDLALTCMIRGVLEKYAGEAS